MLKTIVIFIIALLGFGMIRLPLQNRILEQEKAAGLLDDPVELSSSDYLEQQLAMVSLGGLRSLVAAVLSMEAFDCFLISDWANLERRYNQITSLAPIPTFTGTTVRGIWAITPPPAIWTISGFLPWNEGKASGSTSRRDAASWKRHQRQPEQLVPAIPAGQHVQRYLPPAGF